MRLYFTTSVFDGICNPCQSDTIWVTDKLFATRSDPDDEGVFYLSEVMPESQKLIKIHQPDRGAKTTDAVDIGTFTYTPIPQE